MTITYVVKRTYGKNHDYLQAWCKRWGTACMLSIKHAMRFDTLTAAEAAAARAQSTCMGLEGPAHGFTFTAVPI